MKDCALCGNNPFGFFIDPADVFPMSPPEHIPHPCPDCGTRVETVVMHLIADHGHIKPCGCKVSYPRLQELVDKYKEN